MSGSTDSGVTCVNTSPVSGTWTSGPLAHRPRQPTRLTATSARPSPVTCSTSASRTPWDPVDRQLTAWQT